MQQRHTHTHKTNKKQLRNLRLGLSSKTMAKLLKLYFSSFQKEKKNILAHWNWIDPQIFSFGTLFLNWAAKLQFSFQNYMVLLLNPSFDAASNGLGSQTVVQKQNHRKGAMIKSWIGFSIAAKSYLWYRI